MRGVLIRGSLSVTNDEKQHKKLLAAMGCVVCEKHYGIKDSPVELHHLRTGGWGKGDYKTLIPICHEHHRGAVGIHTLGTKAWEKIFGRQQDYLDTLTAAITGNHSKS